MSRLVAPDLTVAPKVGQVGCYTIGDDVSKIALLMCEDKDSAATPVPDKEKGKSRIIKTLSQSFSSSTTQVCANA